MVELKIKKMIIENFKGTKYAEYEFSDVTNISGKNGSGKSTIPDAFYWLLFNKDAFGNAPGSDKFHEKPLDKDGQEVHNLETIVEAVCELDGERFDMKRCQSENWVKTRGMKTAVYKGNESRYFINGVELKVREFQNRISGICSEDVFRMVAVMSAFNTTDWKKRREILVGMSDVDLKNELLSSAKYVSFAAEIKEMNVSPDDAKKVFAGKLKMFQDELSCIPIRIDEAMKGVENISYKEVSDAEKAIDKLTEQYDALISESGRGNEVSLKNKVSEIEMKILETVKSDSVIQSEKLNMVSDLCSVAKKQMLDSYASLEMLKRKVSDAESRMKLAVQKRDSLREEYNRVYSEKMDTPDVCPTCGQSISEEYFERLKNAFIAQKKERLDSIRESGIAVTKDIEKYCADIEEAKKEIDEFDYESVKAQYEKAVEKREEITNNPYKSDAYASLLIELDNAKKSLDSSSEIGAYKEKIDSVKAELDKYRAIVEKHKVYENAVVRVEELEKRKSELSTQIIGAEQMLQLAEEYISDRCGLLEESINKLFPTIRWKLFNTQINGGVVDTCICMIPCNGSMVSYDSANTASKLRADIEVINVLSEEKGVSLPVFFDNRERVNSVPETDSQMITLRVSDDDKIRIA